MKTKLLSLLKVKKLRREFLVMIKNDVMSDNAATNHYFTQPNIINQSRINNELLRGSDVGLSSDFLLLCGPLM